MNLRSILIRLTEEELELLQEAIEEDLYDEIDKVIDEKNEPSLFGQKYVEGDVYVGIDQRGRKWIHKIIGVDNPNFRVESYFSNGLEIVYESYAWRKVSEMYNWEKVDGNMWEMSVDAFERYLHQKREVAASFARHFEGLLDGACEI